MVSEADSKRNQINAIVAEMRQAYIADMPDVLDELSELVACLIEKESAVSRFEELYRKVHSLKGTSGTYKLDGLFQVSLDFEAYLEQVMPANKDEYVHAVQQRAAEYIEQLHLQLSLLAPKR